MSFEIEFEGGLFYDWEFHIDSRFNYMLRSIYLKTLFFFVFVQYIFFFCLIMGYRDVCITRKDVLSNCNAVRLTKLQ